MNDTWIAESVRSFTNGQISMDPNSWAPPNVWLLEPLFADLWIQKMLQVKALASKKNISIRSLADTMVGPSALRKEFRWALWDMKLMGWEPKRRMEVLDFYRQILESRAGDDVFGLRTTHWHTDDEIETIMKQTKWTLVDDDYKKIIGRISANSPPIIWPLYTDFYYNFTYEMLGLYKDISEYNTAFLPNDVLMIRNYGPFRASELWQESSSYPINKICIKCIYEGLKGHFDFINHFVTEENIMSKLKAFSIEVDGKIVTDKSQLQSINNNIMEMALKQDKLYKALDTESVNRLAVLSKYYEFKDLFAVAGLSWYPEQEVFDRFVGKDPLEITFGNLSSQDERKAFWNEVFDPIHDFSRPELVRAAQTLRARWRHNDG